jgi:hypothetical protein
VVGLAPRAPGDSVRPRRLSDVIVRPRTFTVRARENAVPSNLRLTAVLSILAPTFCLVALGYSATAAGHICGIDRVVAEGPGARVFFLGSVKWEGHSSKVGAIEIENGSIRWLSGGTFSAPVYSSEAGLLLAGEGQQALLSDPREPLGRDRRFCEIKVAEADGHIGVKAVETVWPSAAPYQPQSKAEFVPADAR